MNISIVSDLNVFHFLRHNVCQNGLNYWIKLKITLFFNHSIILLKNVISFQPCIQMFFIKIQTFMDNKRIKSFIDFCPIIFK